MSGISQLDPEHGLQGGSQNPFEGLQVKLKLPDFWQQAAVKALQARKDVVVHAPTGAGKTYIFEMFVENGLKGQAIYTVPTRALANDKLAEWRAKGWDVGIATGDLAENLNAKVVVATLETQKAQFLRGEGPSLLVVDEYQLLSDATRGVNYELSLAMAPPGTQLLLLSGSVANPGDIVDWLKRMRRQAVLVKTTTRPVPLQEVAVNSLPYRVPKQVKGFYARQIAAALMADMGPVLVFAPQRNACEKIARQVAAAFPHDQPLQLSQEQEQLCGGTLSHMLKNRVAFHHSGLSYSVRAGVIEPLARAGQLRVVVATMGLAAGINFSMRSVLVTDTSYMRKNFECRVREDELLQMFGRAGRRGLDEEGYVLVIPDRPRLLDACEARLTRSAQLDWPSLLAVMHTAPDRGEEPFEAAFRLNQRLFSTRQPPLGVEKSLATGEMPCGLLVDAERAQLARPDKVQMRNFRMRWEEAPKPRDVPLREAFMRNKGRWRPALTVASTLENLGKGNLCKIELDTGETAAENQEPEWVYGRELPLAAIPRDSKGSVRISKWFFGQLNKIPAERLQMKLQGKNVSAEEFEQKLLPHLPAFVKQGRVHKVLRRDEQVIAQIDFGSVTVPAMRDQFGNALVDPPMRTAGAKVCQKCLQLENCRKMGAGESPALAWRKLGLIGKDGLPTRRGIIFSFFNKGEGLAIAVALEDESYPIDELVFDIANLRAGHRFSGDDSHYGGHLGMLCQELYDRASYPGYLELGVPENYGDGAAEVMRELAEGGSQRPSGRRVTDLLRPGDIERALLEWQSLLRQIVHAPDLDLPRWRELKQAASDMLNRVDKGEGKRKRLNFPGLTAQQQRRNIRHKLYL